MNNSTLLRGLLVAVLALVTIGVILQSKRASPVVPDDLDRYLDPLTELAPRITAIEVQSGEQLVRVERRAEGWTLISRDGFTAQSEPIQELVRALIGLETTQKMTAKPERHHELGLAWPDETKVARRIRIFVDESPDATTDVIVGNAVQSPTGVYIRRFGDDQSYRAKGRLAAVADVGPWIAGPVAEIESKSIVQIDVGAFNLVQTNQQWEVNPPLAEGAPADPMRDALKSTLPYLLSGFQPDDVRKARTDEPVHEGEIAAIYHLGGGNAVDARLWKESDGIWVRLAFAARATEPNESLDQYAARWAGWMFRVPSWRAGQFEPLFAPPAAP